MTSCALHSLENALCGSKPSRQITSPSWLAKLLFRLKHQRRRNNLISLLYQMAAKCFAKKTTASSTFEGGGGPPRRRNVVKSMQGHSFQLPLLQRVVVHLLAGDVDSNLPLIFSPAENQQNQPNAIAGRASKAWQQRRCKSAEPLTKEN